MDDALESTESIELVREAFMRSLHGMLAFVVCISGETPDEEQERRTRRCGPAACRTSGCCPS